MPTALHPQAKFDPIPPDLDLLALVDRSQNFDWVIRVSISQIRGLGSAGFEKLVQLHVIEGGRPLVIEGWDKLLPESMFSVKWLENTYDKKQENVRDLISQSDIPMTMGHYLRSMKQLTNQWSSTNYRDERRQRLYLKDIDCPTEWYDHLRKVIPPNVFYMNDNVSENVGIDSRHEDDIFGAPAATAAVAGDLMSCLPEEMRAQNLMCYIGHEGTYTPAHKEMCGSLGQNIMVEASSDRNGEKPGSSVWFMTETKDREVVREYFLSMLGHDVEIEKHFAQINAWKKANFPVYVVEQKVGDFILVPPQAPHQVWNRGTRTMKVAWNRTSAETLDLALHEALPRSRLVCRDEQYKNKAMIYYALEKYCNELQSAEETAESGLLGLGRELTNSPRLKHMASDFRRLYELFTEILVSEMFGYNQINTEFIDFDSNITCSYCRSNIFNRFLTCKCCVRKLVNGDEDTYDICMECYAMGRSCLCVSGLQWCEQWQWADLVEKHETWRAMVIKQDGFVDIEYSPQPLEVARKKYGMKSVAQICQEQLRRRPWNDITKPAAPVVVDEPEPEVDDEGRVKKKSKSSRKPKRGELYRCHVCCHKDNTYKLNFCTTCTEAYCYGVLFRAFDTMPQAAMQQEYWQCPKCLGICNCGSCRKAGNTTPYVPKSTLLGHDTRKVADDRSVESIVDFRIHNLSWLKGAGEEPRSKDSKRMQRLREAADAEKAKDPLAGLETADDAPHEIENSLQDPTTQDLDVDDPHQGAEPAEDEDANGSRVQVADMSGTQNEEGDSAYPDPSAYPSPSVGGRLMGMGFYDQDNSADRILFDAFQMPSANALDNEPQVSEYVKKTLRLAKRKARLEGDDDPDFQGPRSHHRKKPKTGNIDQLVNLDPALLGALGETTASALGPPTHAGVLNDADEGSAAVNDSVQQRAAPAPKPVRQPLPNDPLRPQLRHAKPTKSYVEAEEPVEDPEDSLVIRPIRLFGSSDEAEDGADPVDLAAEAVRALTGEVDASKATSTPQSTGKKRGRPPGKAGRPPNSTTTSAPVSAAKDGKKRGRPPRITRSQPDDGLESTVNSGHANDDDDGIQSDELEAEIETALAQDNEAELRSGGLASSEPTRKRRGRPPGRKSMPALAAEAKATSPGPTRYMSMAERMAARGKKFKMRAESNGSAAESPASISTPLGAKGMTRTARPTPRNKVTASAARRQEGSESVSTSDDDSRGASASTSRPGGPTVVRLHLSDDEFGSSDSDSDFDDDEGIPAVPKYTATRGRGRGRGSRLGGPGRPRTRV